MRIYILLIRVCVCVCIHAHINKVLYIYILIYNYYNIQRQKYLECKVTFDFARSSYHLQDSVFVFHLSNIRLAF